jgi:hypothetical protein
VIVAADITFGKPNSSSKSRSRVAFGMISGTVHPRFFALHEHVNFALGSDAVRSLDSSLQVQPLSLALVALGRKFDDVDSSPRCVEGSAP